MVTRGNARANTCAPTRLSRRVVVISYRTSPGLPGHAVTHDNGISRMASADDKSFELLTYQLPTVGYWPTAALTGNGELGFDSGEGA